MGVNRIYFTINYETRYNNIRLFFYLALMFVFVWSLNGRKHEASSLPLCQWDPQVNLLVWLTCIYKCTRKIKLKKAKTFPVYKFTKLPSMIQIAYLQACYKTQELFLRYVSLQWSVTMLLVDESLKQHAKCVS